jgi:hypothetical protein
MRRAIILIFQLGACAACCAEALRFKQFGTPIPARPDLEVRWNAPSDALPSQIWVYHLLPRKLSPEMISYIMALCSFTERDKTESSKNEMVFKTPDNSRHLWISSSGDVDYDSLIHYSHTNLIKKVPDEKQALKRVKQLLPKLGISLSDIDKKDNSDEPRLNSSDSKMTYFVKPEPITNTLFRAVGFRRAIDGISFIGMGTGGDGHVRFGDHGKITKIDLSWRNMERVKSYPTLFPAEMIYALRQGKAVQGYLLMNSRGINWRTAKSVTINHVWPRYYAGTSMHPSDMLEPFAVLDADVDTGHGNVRVEIDCPIIDN